MLQLSELNDVFDRLGTPQMGRRLVEKARRESPVRDVQSRLGNVVTKYASKKMARTIQTESRTVEFPAVIQYEHDTTVLEYFEQPCKIDLILTDGGAKKAFRLQHTPDFLLVYRDKLVLEEWREEDRLVALARKHPGRWVKEVDGWHFPEAEAQLAELGIVYRIRSADELPRQYVRNLIFLSDYLDPAHPPIDVATTDKIRAPFAEKLVVGLPELIAAVSSDGLTSDDVYKSIADRVVSFDLYNDDLAETHRVRVFRDDAAMALMTRCEQTPAVPERLSLAASIEVGAQVDYQGVTYNIALVGDKSVMLTSDDGTSTSEISLELLTAQYLAGKLNITTTNKPLASEPSSLDALTPKQIDQVLERASLLDAVALSPKTAPVSRRTLQRYQKAVRDAGDSAIAQNLALVPQHVKKGNRTAKVPQVILDCMARVAQDFFNKPSGISKRNAYTRFVAACQETGIQPCSQKTFNRRIDELTSTRKREGKRMAYQKAPIVWYLRLSEPIHGVRPFEYVHIDHTPLDIKARGPNQKKVLGRVWLTLAMDAESRSIVGFYLTFEPPSYRSCMMVLRDIVRRHGRLPEMLVLDNGAEFRSQAMARVCQLYGCSLRFRPAGQPRFGSVMERLFGTVHSQLIHNLEGNTSLMKHVRTVTKSVRPEQFVEWTLPALHGALDYYFERIYGTEIHPAHGDAPVEHFIRRMQETGMRRNRLVRFDRTFLIETCPTPDDRGARCVDGQRGIKINHIWYWCDAFRASGMDGKSVDVRVDPWDVRHVYAFVNNSWHQCLSKLAGILRDYTTIEIRYAFDELARKHGIQKKELTPERVAEWLRVLDAKNFDARLVEQQSEARYLYRDFGMTAVESVEAPGMVSPTANMAIAETPVVRTEKTVSVSDLTEEETYELF